MSALFLVESPLQYINAIEARDYYRIPCNDSRLIIFEGVSTENLKQIILSSKGQLWKKILIVKNNHHPLLRYIALMRCMNFVRDLHIDTIFIGEYRSDIMRHIIHKKSPFNAVLLDDGNVTPEIYEKNRFRIPIKLTFRRKALNTLFRLVDSDLFDIEYFSCYQLGNLKPKNEFNLLSKNLENKLSSELILFLGNNTVEMDIIKIEDYIEALEKIKSHYKSSPIKYVPHRREEKWKLDIISQLDIELMPISVPFEIFLSQMDKIPKEIASFVSSALDSCFKIIGHKIQIVSFRLASHKFSEPERESFDNCYQNYLEYSDKFKVIEIN